MQNNLDLDSSMNDPAYQQRLKDTLHEIQNAFKKIDKNGDDLIDKEELTKFLDNNMSVEII
jgi:Ca2+-binding EF-hand superfamily protein